MSPLMGSLTEPIVATEQPSMPLDILFLWRDVPKSVQREDEYSSCIARNIIAGHDCNNWKSIVFVKGMERY